MSKFLNNLRKIFFSLFRIEEWKRNKNKRLSGQQWLMFFKVISKKERFFFSFFSGLLVISAVFWWRLEFLESTKVIPAEGGILREAIIGQPKTLNPIFSLLNDADRDVSELIFSGLLDYDKEGNLVKDLAETYKISEDGKTYEFTLKDGLLWSDGASITADDVIFTINTIQNPKVQSPLRFTFQDIKTEKIDEKNVKLVLPNAYSPFVENFTFKILPKHIFEGTEPHNFFSGSKENIISSGSFKIRIIEKDEDGEIKKIILEPNPNYYQKKPYISELELFFVKDKTELLKLKEEVTILTDISPKEKEKIKKYFTIYSFYSTRSFALFLNQKNKILSQKEVREALALATPKKEIIDGVFEGEARQVDTPLLPENKVGGDFKKYDFNLDEAKKKLDEAGWKVGSDGVREKVLEEGGQALKLEINLITVKQPELVETANIVQQKWQEIGAKLNIQDLEGEKLRQDYLTERKYDILLLGAPLNFIYDPSSFWFSTQKNYPGLNFSLYESKETDDIIKNILKEFNEEKRQQLLQSFQAKLTEDIPAIFLFSPNYLYAIKEEIKGLNGKYILNPSKRFIGIEEWYIKEKRVPK